MIIHSFLSHLKAPVHAAIRFDFQLLGSLVYKYHLIGSRLNKHYTVIHRVKQTLLALNFDCVSHEPKAYPRDHQV